MNAGQLRHLVALQSYTEARAADGHATKTWSTYAWVWVGVRTLSGNERTAAQQAGATQTHEFALRYRSGVQPDHRLLWGTRSFDIKDVRNFDERNIELRLRAVEVPAQGPASSGSPSTSTSASPSPSPSA